jgi:16S rRNA (guanine527-N7)-methyltransferase
MEQRLARHGKMHRVIASDLAGSARALGIAVDAQAWARLEALVELWLRYGRAINLTGARTRDALVGHVGDGLATAAVVERLRALGPATRWLDVGSGAGFPALVVAAIRPIEVVLVEPRERRAAFLELAGQVGVWGEFEVRRTHVERSTWCENALIGGGMPDERQFDVATSRAVFPPAEWLELGLATCRPDGIVVVHGEIARSPPGVECAGTVVGRLGLVSAYRRAP